MRFFDGSSPYYADLNIYSASNQYAEPIDTDYAYAIDGVLRYKINELAVGSYRIAARASFFGTDIEEFYSDAQTVELAKDVVVKPGGNHGGYQFYTR